MMMLTRARFTPQFALILVTIALLGLSRTTRAQGVELGFSEVFALAEDRAAVLDQLVPGTGLSYYYRCLERQAAGDLEEVDRLLEIWEQRHPHDSRKEEIARRQALLAYDVDPTRTWTFLEKELHLSFDHRPAAEDRARELPRRLDPSEFTRSSLLDWVKRHRRQNVLKGLRDSGLGLIAPETLTPDELTEYLRRLDRPDVPNLARLVVRDLDHPRSRGFGSLDIHDRLLLNQLEECATLRPRLLQETRFVDAWMRRLHPREGADWRHDAAEREAYLERLSTLTQRLPASFNSLKAHVLYHRLLHDWQLGRPSEERLLEYLRLPRRSDYVNPRYLREVGGGEQIDFDRDYRTGLGKIGQDEPLLRAYLSHFLRDREGTQAFAPYLAERYLARLFAETKILAGDPNTERWYSLLDDPGYYERLKERVEIEFAPTQPTHYSAADPVSIEVDLKNVPKLIVKVFEIDTFNYYRELQREVDPALDLDGFVANEETTHEYDEGPLLRHRRRFELPGLNRPGVYVVELIGNGLSSRALIHKGALQLQERVGPAGHLMRVVDEDGQPVEGATIWFGDREWKPEEGGEIAIPFSTDPGEKTLLLRHGGLTSLASFMHMRERYGLEAGVFVEREQLVPGRKAQVLVRPRLRLNGRPISIDLLEDPKLILTSTDVAGVPSTTEIAGFELFDDRDAVHEIFVPEGLRRLDAQLIGKLKRLTDDEDEELSTAVATFELNAIDQTLETTTALLGRDRAGWHLDLVGKNGEAWAGRAVSLTFEFRHFTDDRTVALASDGAGRVHLGPLDEVRAIRLEGMVGGTGRWTLDDRESTGPDVVHGVVGDVLRIPYDGTLRQADRSELSLLELRDGQYTRDLFGALAIDGGAVELRGLAAGEYSFRMLGEDTVRVRVAPAPGRAGWAQDGTRRLELPRRSPLRIRDARIDDEGLVVSLADGLAGARVHVIGTRYAPTYDPFEELVLTAERDLSWETRASHDSRYTSGRGISDEYRYILERRYAKKFPGNMLERPSLILNPWSLDETVAQGGPSSPGPTSLGMGGGAGGAARHGGRGGRRQSDYLRPGTIPNLAFLPDGAVVLANLSPDENGDVRVPLEALGEGSLIQIVALDHQSTIRRDLYRDETPYEPLDQRLRASLDPTRHLVQEKSIEVVGRGESVTIEELRHARIKVYDTLTSVHRLFRSLNDDPELARFAFLTSWPSFDEAEKRALYSEHACHELHVFLARKDPAFFEAVVRPYLANKAHKEFLDEWLLGRDLERYLDPWAFARLNVVERILLMKRLEGRGEEGRRHAQDLYDLLTPDLDAEAWRFGVALSTGSLEDAEGAEALVLELGETLEAEESEPVLQDRVGAAPRRSKSAEGGRKEELRALGYAGDADGITGSDDFFLGAGQAEMRARAQLFYRGPDATRPYVETHYWKRTLADSGPGLIGINGFWLDFATTPEGTPFVSSRVAEASGNFAEMALALAFLDLPFEAPETGTEALEGRVRIAAESPLILVREELRDGDEAVGAQPILVSQSYFRHDDRYRFEGNQRIEKPVDEFVVGVPYGVQVVLTNPTSARRELETLLQIPAGSIPLMRTKPTAGRRLALGAFATTTFEYAFYFPAVGRYRHYPVHVSTRGEHLAHAEATELDVLREATRVDTTSWAHVSQRGTTAEVVTFLREHNPQRLELHQIAWRMQDPAVFDAVTDLLRERRAYDPTLWSYSIRHRRPAAAREFLRRHTNFVGSLGLALESPLLSIDPFERRTYEHVEFAPLFNARAHRFGRRRRILDLGVAAQYTSFLDLLAYRPRLSDADRAEVTYYLLLQDRIEEALAHFERIDPAKLESRLQYDYMAAYLDFFDADTSRAERIAARYEDYPVERWRELFAEVRRHAREARGDGDAGGEGRETSQDRLAAAQPALEIEVEGRELVVRYEAHEALMLNLYEMDVEFLFSTSPFMQAESTAFSYVKPNFSQRIALPADRRELRMPLPARFQAANVLLEARADGQVRRQTYFANALSIRTMENFGQLEVRREESGQLLPTVYVKVFARDGNGQVRFYKDGYTDLRGRFDYASLSGPDGQGAKRYAILVSSDELGSAILEVAPPTK